MSDPATALNLSFVQAPHDIVMPSTIETAFTVLFAASGVLVGAYALYLSIRRQSPVPLLLLFGGLFTVLLEAPADLLINVTHPPVGQHNAYVSRGVAVPVYVVLAYFSYYGSLTVFLFDRILAQSMTSADWWKLTAGTAFMLVIGESACTWLGLFHFYGEHPLWIGPMPLWFEGANTASVMVPALLVYRLIPTLQGAQRWLIPFIVPAVACAAHFGAGIPAYNVLGMHQDALPRWAIEASGVASVGFSVLLIWLAIRLAAPPSKSAQDPG